MPCINLSTVAPWVVTLLATAFGFYQFKSQQRQSNKRPFLEHQLAMCITATETAAKLATETDAIEWNRQRAVFWQLYWGKLALVEDRDVESKMVEFSQALPKSDVAQISLPVDALKIHSLNLAHAARKLILESWDVKLAPLQRET